jgi:hypothetical protein
MWNVFCRAYIKKKMRDFLFFRSTTGLVIPIIPPETTRKFAEQAFDPKGRDRNRSESQKADMNDVRGEDYDSNDTRLRIHVKEIRIPPNDMVGGYEQRVKDALAYDFKPESINEAIENSNNLLTDVVLNFDWNNFKKEKEAILWHGTRESTSDRLATTAPVSRSGAYGHGFYLTPHIGKADQYAIADGESGSFLIMAYRVILSNSNYFHLKNEGPLRFHEVVVSDPANIVHVATIKYERYMNNLDSPTDTETPATGLRKRKT